MKGPNEGSVRKIVSSTTSDRRSDDDDKLAEIISLVSHGFEGHNAENAPRLQYFIKYFHGLKSVLDIGCGEGLMLELLRAGGIEATGLDLDPARVTVARNKGLNAIVGDAEQYLRGTEAKFEGIFLRHVIEHFDGPDAIRLLYACRKSLAEGGIVAIVTPNFGVREVAERIFWLDITHRRPYPLPLLRHIFSVLALEVVAYGIREAEPEKDCYIVGKAALRRGAW